MKRAIALFSFPYSPLSICPLASFIWTALGNVATLRALVGPAIGQSKESYYGVIYVPLRQLALVACGDSRWASGNRGRPGVSRRYRSLPESGQKGDPGTAHHLCRRRHHLRLL